MTATFAQIPFVSGTYTSIAQQLPLALSQVNSNNMGVPGDGYITIGSTSGYYRIGANIQIAGKIGSQSVFYIKHNSTIIEQYFVDELGNQVVAFETIIYATAGDTISLHLTVGTGGAVIINPPNNLLYPSALFAYLITDGGSGGFTAGGDLSGTFTSQTLIGIQGNPISATTPSIGQFIEWNGSTWISSTTLYTINYQDAIQNSINIPGVGYGPGTTQSPPFPINGVFIWESDSVAEDNSISLIGGLQGQDMRGETTIIIPEVSYPTNPWNTQQQITGQTKFGDTVTGPGIVSYFNFRMQLNNTNSGVCSATIKVQAVIVSRTGGTEAVGDCYSTTFEYVWYCAGGTGGGTPLFSEGYSSPVFSNTDLMRTSSVGLSGFPDGPPGITYTSPAGLDAATVIDIQCHVVADCL